MRAQAGSIVRHVSVWVLLVSLIAAALLSVSGRVLVANVEHFKSAIEQELADYGITGVSLDAVSGGWQGFHPLLKIKGASLSIPGRSQALSIDDLALTVKLIPSLFAADLKLESFSAAVTKLILVHTPDGQWWLNDIPLGTQSEHRQTAVNVFAFFQRLPDFVNIDIKLLQVRDQVNDIDYLVQRSALSSSRRGDQLSLRFSALLPGSLGEQVELLANGDAQRMRIYLDAQNLDLARVLQLAGYTAKGLRQARLSLQSWGELHDYRVTSIVNRARLFDVRLGHETAQSDTLALNLLQRMAPVDDGWRIDSTVDRLQYGDRPLQSFQSQVAYRPDARHLDLWVDAIAVQHVDDLLDFMVDDEAVRHARQALQVSAGIENLLARLDLQRPQQSRFGFDFIDLAAQPYRNIPGVQTLSGHVVADTGNARVWFEPNPATATFTSLFRDPIELQQFSASVDISVLESGWLLAADRFELANQDIDLVGRAWIEAPRNGRPYLSLRTAYSEGRMASTSKYLPVSIMPERTVEWLDRAISDGLIPRGDLMFHGRLQKFSVLEKNQSGLFHALFDVHDPHVKFLPDWPPARRGFGRASFHNLSMELAFADVDFAGATLESVKVGIADMLRAQLVIEGFADNDSQTLVSALAAMPVLNVMDEIEQRSEQLAGSIRSTINLTVPLRKPSDSDWLLSARADLSDVDLVIPAWLVDLRKVNGSLHIDQQEIHAEGLQARYGNAPVKINIGTDSTNQLTRFDVRGSVDSAKLAESLPPYLSKPVSGVSPWDIRVAVAHDPQRSDATSPRVTVTATSQLQGTRLDFPQPLRVATDEQAEFRFSGKLHDGLDLDYRVKLGDRVTAQGRVANLDGASPQLSYTNLAFSNAQLPAQRKGIRLSGVITALNVNDWQAFERRYVGEQQDPSALLERVQSVDLGIKQVTWGGHEIDSSRLRLNRQGDRLVGEIDSSIARGRVQLPDQMTAQQPVLLELDELKLRKAQRDHEYRPGISEMPSLSITAKALTVEDMEFADLKFHTENADNMFLIKQLDFSRNQVKLESSGNWQYDAVTDEHVSVFNVRLHGPQFGKTVSDLGLGDSIRGGSIDMQGQIGWGGSLFDLNWPTLIGEVSLSLTDGYFRNIEPGAGRVVGLLSLSALPRRLFLDFGDVLNEGMQFDEITGDFRINGEVMTTQNASMRSASAKLRLAGETNLRRKTYDQSIAIIPRVGDTIPVIGSIAAGSGVGWGLLLLQRIFKKPIEKSVEIEYKITGTWEDPVLTLVQKPELDDALSDDDVEF